MATQSGVAWAAVGGDVGLRMQNRKEHVSESEGRSISVIFVCEIHAKQKSTLYSSEVICQRICSEFRLSSEREGSFQRVIFLH